MAETLLKLDDGWSIKMLEGFTQWNDIKRYYGERYYCVHSHNGYDYPTQDAFSRTVIRCSQCNIAVPTEVLGFLELLRWEK